MSFIPLGVLLCRKPTFTTRSSVQVGDHKEQSAKPWQRIDDTLLLKLRERDNMLEKQCVEVFLRKITGKTLFWIQR